MTMLAAISLLIFSPAAPAPADYSIQPVSGNPLTAKVISVAADGTLTADSTSFKPGEWFSFQRGPRPDWPAEAQVILTNGDRIAANFLDGDEKSIRVKALFGTDSAEVRIPFTAIDVLWLDAPPADSPAFPDRYSWLKNDRKNDIVRLANGEVLTGDLERLKANGEIQLKERDKSRTLPAKLVQAVAFNPALTVRKQAAGVRYQIATATGTRITATQLHSDEKQFHLTAGFGAKLAIPTADIVSVTRWSNDVLSLASLKPAKAEEIPYGILVWNWSANRNIRFDPLRLKTQFGVETFESGLGTHASSMLEYKLDGKYRAFEALVGFNAVHGRRGTANLRIVVDGKAADLPKLQPLAAADGPQSLRVDLEKAKTLALVTDFGPIGDVQADVNWIDARLIK